MKEFNLDNLERKNIYKVPDNLFENIQERVMNDVKADKRVPIFKLYLGYAVAAAVALIFGITFVFNWQTETTKDMGDQESYAQSKEVKTESEMAYETLKADLTSVEKNNQIVEIQRDEKYIYAQDNTAKEDKKIIKETVNAVSKQDETQMNEYLDSFTNSEIAELASNSTQDVYLDLYN